MSSTRRIYIIFLSLFAGILCTGAVARGGTVFVNLKLSEITRFRRAPLLRRRTCSTQSGSCYVAGRDTFCSVERRLS